LSRNATNPGIELILQASLDAAVRKQPGATEPVGLRGAELRHELVVGADHLVVQVGVITLAHERRRVVGAEDQLGVDPVLLLLGDAGLRVVAAGVDLVKPAPATHLLRVAAGGRAPAERDDLIEAGEHPAIALVERFDPRHEVLVL
jgi:hypothetical protein